MPAASVLSMTATWKHLIVVYGVCSLCNPVSVQQLVLVQVATHINLICLLFVGIPLEITFLYSQEKYADDYFLFLQ